VRVYLIRHAQSEENALDLKRRMTGEDFNEILRRSPDAALTPLGVQQAHAVAAALADRGIERLYASPFFRTRSTAAVIAQRLGLEPELVDDLREVLPQPSDRRKGSQSLRRFWLRSYARMLWPRGLEESWLDGYRRARRAFAHITAAPAESVAAVSHRGLLSLLLLVAQRHSRWRVVQRDLRNGGVSIIQSRGR
jgi:probable phosphoglycerate mutase